MGQSKISYLDWVVNPYSQNCIPVSDGCKNCYAKVMQQRFGKAFVGAPTWVEKRVAEFTKIPTGVVCGINFLSDTWHEDAPLEWIDRIHHLIRQRPDVTFVYVTKRAERLAEDAHRLQWPANLWVGVSVETTKYLWRIDCLREVPTDNRWVSFEPLLGPIATYDRTGLGWIVTGGESGDGARRMSPDWAWDIGKLAMEQNIPWYHKQGSGRYPDQNYDLNGETYRQMPDSFKANTETVKQTALF